MLADKINLNSFIPILDYLHHITHPSTLTGVFARTEFVQLKTVFGATVFSSFILSKYWTIPEVAESINTQSNSAFAFFMIKEKYSRL